MPVADYRRAGRRTRARRASPKIAAETRSPRPRLQRRAVQPGRGVAHPASRPALPAARGAPVTSSSSDRRVIVDSPCLLTDRRSPQRCPNAAQPHAGLRGADAIAPLDAIRMPRPSARASLTTRRGRRSTESEELKPTPFRILGGSIVVLAESGFVPEAIDPYSSNPSASHPLQKTTKAV